MANVHFRELDRCNIGKNRYLVASERVGDGKLSIAQQVEASVDENETIKMFIKNAINVDNEGLDNIIEMLIRVRDQRKSQE